MDCYRLRMDLEDGLKNKICKISFKYILDNSSKLTRAELQSGGCKNTSTARNELKDILKTKAQNSKQ